jgi:hypothetical protein
VAGEIALEPPEPDSAKAKKHFERAFAVARKLQAKSWELRAAMSLARRCSKRANCWLRYTARDLKEAKAMLEELAA